MLTSIVEQALADILPDGMWPVEPNGIGMPYLKCATTANAITAE